VNGYPSAAWIDRAAGAVAGDAALQQLRPPEPFVIQQTVGTATEVDDAPSLVWHVAFGPDGVHLRGGRPAHADVTFACDLETARSIHNGEQSAQGAFMAGHLRVGGDINALLAHQDLLASLSDALGAVRDVTGP